jgi:hypothetical protein
MLDAASYLDGERILALQRVCHLAILPWHFIPRQVLGNVNWLVGTLYTVLWKGASHKIHTPGPRPKSVVSIFSTMLLLGADLSLLPLPLFRHLAVDSPSSPPPKLVGLMV